MNLGKIVQVIGPVVDLEFSPGRLPQILNAVRIKREGEDKGAGSQLIVEVAQHLGDNIVRAIALGPTDGLKRGMIAEDTGAPITVPVGKNCLGRLMNVLGEQKDYLGEIQSPENMPIHRLAPSFVEQETKPQIFETGIKVIDL